MKAMYGYRGGARMVLKFSPNLMFAVFTKSGAYKKRVYYQPL